MIELFHKDARACLEALWVAHQALPENSEGLLYREVYIRLKQNLDASASPVPLEYKFPFTLNGLIPEDIIS